MGCCNVQVYLRVPRICMSLNSRLAMMKPQLPGSNLNMLALLVRSSWRPCDSGRQWLESKGNAASHSSRSEPHVALAFCFGPLLAAGSASTNEGSQEPSIRNVHEISRLPSVCLALALASCEPAECAQVWCVHSTPNFSLPWPLTRAGGMLGRTPASCGRCRCHLVAGCCCCRCRCYCCCWCWCWCWFLLGVSFWLDLVVCCMRGLLKAKGEDEILCVNRTH